MATMIVDEKLFLLKRISYDITQLWWILRHIWPPLLCGFGSC